MSFIIESFELLSERPEHVRELKKLILELAIRGKLVHQKNEDVQIEYPLKKMLEEKALLFKQKKIKKPKKYSPISTPEIPYEIPGKWNWARLENVSHDFGQKKPDVKFTYVDVGAINKELGIVSDDVKILNPNEAPSRARKIVKKGCVIYSTVRPYLLNISIVQRDFEFEPIVSTAFAILNPLSQLNNEYLFYYLRSQTFIEYVESQMLGMAYPAINDKNFFNGLIPLPPLAEQLRIVQKVNSLFQKIDALADQTQRAQITRQKLRTAFLQRLDQANSANQLSKAWQSLTSQFDTVFDSVDAIKALRKSILQLAVKGKLVAQNGEDESASVLLEKIKKEKERLVEEKKIKKQKVLPKIEKEDIPYKAPLGWSWCLLNDLCLYITDGTHQTPKYTEKGRIFLSARNVKPFKFMPEKCKYVSEEHYQNYIKNRKPELNDVLLTRVGSNIGEAAKINVELDFAIYVSVALIKPIHPFVNPDYLVLWLNSPSGTEKSITNTYGRGMSQGNLNLGLIRKFAFPFPPLAEQKRIVEKVGQLMSWCDDLESLLEKRAAKKERLLGRVLKGVFEEEGVKV